MPSFMRRSQSALLGRSDLETTHYTYTHVIPESQLRAVGLVARVLFSDVLKLDPDSKEPGASTNAVAVSYGERVVSRVGLEPTTR